MYEVCIMYEYLPSSSRLIDGELEIEAGIIYHWWCTLHFQGWLSHPPTYYLLNDPTTSTFVPPNNFPARFPSAIMHSPMSSPRRFRGLWISDCHVCLRFVRSGKPPDPHPHHWSGERGGPVHWERSVADERKTAYPALVWRRRHKFITQYQAAYVESSAPRVRLELFKQARIRRVYAVSSEVLKSWN